MRLLQLYVAGNNKRAQFFL